MAVSGVVWVEFDLLWGRHYYEATPTLRDTQEGQVDGIWTHKQASTEVILSNQTEECPLHWVWSNIPEWSSELMIELRQNWLNDISSGWMIQPWLRWYDLKENEPWQGGECQGSFYLGSYLLSWSPIDLAKFISSGWSQCPIPIPITSSSFWDVHPSSYIVHLMQ